MLKTRQDFLLSVILWGSFVQAPIGWSSPPLANDLFSPSAPPFHLMPPPYSKNDPYPHTKFSSPPSSYETAENSQSMVPFSSFDPQEIDRLLPNVSSLVSKAIELAPRFSNPFVYFFPPKILSLSSEELSQLGKIRAFDITRCWLSPIQHDASKYVDCVLFHSMKHDITGIQSLLEAGAKMWETAYDREVLRSHLQHFPHYFGDKKKFWKIVDATRSAEADPLNYPFDIFYADILKPLRPTQETNFSICWQALSQI